MPENIELKQKIYRVLRECQLDVAEELALKGMEEDFHSQDLEKILKIIKFWQNRAELFTYSENHSEKLLKEWDSFIDFCQENQLDNKKAILSIKDFVFRKVIDSLIDSYRLSPVPERETLVLLGESFYEIGMTDKAIETLEYAMSISQEDEDVRIYAMLGNLYAESGEKDLAMLLYNDIFLKFPQVLNLEKIDFPPIQRLIQIIREDGFRDNEVAEWVPFYGYVYGGLTAKRKLEYKDYIDLQEKIKDYEKALRVDKKVIRFIIPRLINFYLWVLDYYLFQAGAVHPGQSVIRRIMELLGALAVEEKVKKKLKDKAEAVFRQLQESQAGKIASIKKGTPCPS